MTPDTECARRIRETIRRDGPLSFARFMEMALYEPGLGYYERGGRLGTEGADYFTASDVGPAFARCLARQIAEIDRLAGPFDPFHVLEFGAGRGLLAADLLAAMPAIDAGLARRLRYVAVDRAAGMRSSSARTAPAARAASPGEVGAGHRGCIVAVELFDALPVHRLRRRAGRLVEVLVGVDDDGALCEVEGPPDAAAEELARRYGAAREEGTEAEVAPGVIAQVATMDEALAAGVWIVVDYGDRAERLYGPDRPRGTLMAYHRHAAGEDYLARPGEQDLTAHVNFSAVEDAARARGLEPLGLTTQDRFLIGNGLLEAFEQPDLASANDPRRAKARLQAMQLIHPHGMGRAFRVLLLGRDCRPALSGLVDPFA